MGCIGGGIIGSGNLESETFNFSDFTEVEAQNGFQGGNNEVKHL